MAGAKTPTDGDENDGLPSADDGRSDERSGKTGELILMLAILIYLIGRDVAGYVAFRQAHADEKDADLSFTAYIKDSPFHRAREGRHWNYGGGGGL